MKAPGCLLVTVDFPPSVTGGIQRYYYDLCRESNGRISVLAPRSEGCDHFDKAQSFDVKRVRLPMRGSPLSRALLTILITLHAARVLLFGSRKKLIVGHWFLLPTLLGVGRLRSVQTAAVMHGGELSRFRPGSMLRRVVVAAINRCDEVIVNSSYTAGQFAERGVEKSRIKVLTPGVDSGSYQPATEHAPHRLLGKSEFDGITLLTVGTLVERKGHARVISVLPRILAKHPPTRYVIIGDGPCRSDLTAQASRLGLARSVHLLGRATDAEVVQWMRACDIFVMVSKNLPGQFGEEGFGIVYLEANACGKPVVGGDSGGVRDAVIDGVTGLLVNPLDSEALFEALDRLISRKDLRDSLGQQGRQRAVNEFQWRDRVEALLAGSAGYE